MQLIGRHVQIHQPAGLALGLHQAARQFLPVALDGDELLLQLLHPSGGRGRFAGGGLGRLQRAHHARGRLQDRAQLAHHSFALGESDLAQRPGIGLVAHAALSRDIRAITWWMSSLVNGFFT